MELEKNKKFFSIAAPTMNLRKRGRGYRVKNVPRIYSAGKCAVFALCVRTQNDFCRKGGISVPPHNKTRLNRFIFVYNGRYTRKQGGTTQYYYALLAKIAQNRAKCAISHSPPKLTNFPIGKTTNTTNTHTTLNRKLHTEQKFSPPVLSIYENLN